MIDIRIAAITCRAVTGDIDGNLARTVHWTRKAKAAGAALICFPELNITGYGIQPETADLALTIPGPVTDRLCRVAKDNDMIILAGFIEYNPKGLPYISHGVFHPTGHLAVYRKLHLAPQEQLLFAAGDTIPLFQYDGLCFGIQLCYDGHFPELASTMTRTGAEVLFMPHASPRGDARTKHRSWMRHLPARAYDNGIYVVACNQWGENQKGLSFPGNALILDPSGRILQKDLTGGEGMLIADLTREAMTYVRNHPMRHFFPNRRPELYK